MNRIKNNKIRVMIGLSGGVDSSVAAALLKKQGYQVIGVFLKFWHTPKTRNYAEQKCNAELCGNENKCCDYESLVVARSVAEKLKIPFYVMDASKEFKKEVVDYFVKEYDSGRTPNPCVVCNKKIKFGWMLEQAKKLGCDYIATGHYARIKCSLATSQKDVHFFHGAQASGKRLQPTFCDCAHSLYQACDKKKDQSYFLWQLNQEQLSHTLFPIGDYTKEEVRKMAKKWHLPSAEKKESQDLCFIGADKADFLANYADKLDKPGIIIDKNGNTLGQHKGLCYYTVGQREGLGIQLIANHISRIADRNSKNDSSTSFGTSKPLAISNKQASSFQPAYVIKLNIEKNQLIVGSQVDLNSFELVAEKVNWVDSCDTIHVTCNKNLKYQAKIRYGVPLVDCYIVILSQDKIKVTFNKPQRAIASGQSIVFYNKKEVIGGGIIL